MEKKSNSVGKVILFLVKSPYIIGKKMYGAGKYINEKAKEGKIRKKRKLIKPLHEEFNVLKVNEGDYEKWREGLRSSDSKIGVIIGARGTGKTAFGMKFLENMYAQNKKKCYAMGFQKEDYKGKQWAEVLEHCYYHWLFAVL